MGWELEITNKLFLELSQFATAKTRQEMEWEKRADSLLTEVSRLLTWQKKAADLLERLGNAVPNSKVPELRDIVRDADILVAELQH